MKKKIYKKNNIRYQLVKLITIKNNMINIINNNNNNNNNTFQNFDYRVGLKLIN